MKKWIKKSFHRQLLFCFAVVALFPLLLFGVSLIQTMETKINSDYEKRVTEQAEQIDADKAGISVISFRVFHWVLK